MATKLEKPIERALTRATDTKGKPLVARVSPEGVYLKPKGTRWENAYFVPWGTIYMEGAARKARETKLEREAARVAKQV